MSNKRTDLKPTGHGDKLVGLKTGTVWLDKILYFGNWSAVSEPGCHYHCSNTQYNAFEFSFRGPSVKWMGSKRSNHGCADVFIDGEFQQRVDCYSAEALCNVAKFERNGLSSDRIHTLRVVVMKDRNSKATDCYQDVTSIESVAPLSYPFEISNTMNAEYAQIQSGVKPYAAADSWSPVKKGAHAPDNGVMLDSGVFREAFERNIDYLNQCFASPTYCDGLGWSEWLPASNDGRMLAGAGNSLRWEERADMREIVDVIIDGIEKRMRADGYYNYYEESDSYALSADIHSERKNYDRVFWTRGMLAAGLAGNSKAYGLLRRMYDWFNSSPYLPWILIGGNATNGLPGGPLVYSSPAGKDDDLLVTERYYDQDYWMRELANREPLCLSFYPGERPHCYNLLGLEAFVDEYRATGAQKYIDAVNGGWDIYIDNFKHVGGATAIMESHEIYPPKSYYFTSKKTGETCGSTFWINLNSKLLQLYPDEEKYAAEIEESLYNVIMANQDKRGYIRYHSKLHGSKNNAGCHNTCCEVSTSGLIARLPEFIYSTADDGLYVNLFASSAVTWSQGGDDVTLSTTTDFPFDPEVSMKISTVREKPMNIRIRVPSWASGEMTVNVNGSDFAAGVHGTYVSVNRRWSEGDVISFRLPIGFRTVQYKGLDQIDGNYDRYALLYGPVLMALQGDLQGPGGVPHIVSAPEDLPGLLTAVEGVPLEFTIRGFPEYRYVPYWKLSTETFTCFPIIQNGGLTKTG